MSTIAGKRAATIAPLGRVVRCCFVLLLCAGLGLAIPFVARPCQAQSAPAQNATPPPPPPDDPPPSLIHHPKPTPAPAQTNTTPAPAPAQQTPATQSDATKGAEPPSGSAAAQPATQDPAAASSTIPSTGCQYAARVANRTCRRGSVRYTILRDTNTRVAANRDSIGCVCSPCVSRCTRG